MEWILARFNDWIDRRTRRRTPVTPVDAALFGQAPADETGAHLDLKGLTLRPPASLSVLAPALVEAGLDDQGDCIVRWSLACNCGREAGGLLGHPLSGVAPERVSQGDSDPLLSPLVFVCRACNRETVFLDTNRHGYHAEIARAEGGAGSAKLTGSGSPTPHSCPLCGKPDFAMVAVLAYWDLEEIGEAALELSLAPEDLFNTFELECECLSCQHRSQPTDFGKL